MSYENRLERRTLGGQVNEDHQDTQDSSPIYNIITAAVAGAVGYKLFKAGAFKEVVGSLMEYADALSKGGDVAVTTMSSIKQWSKLKDIPAASLAKSGQSYLPPKNSIFRPRDSSIFYDIFQDLQSFDLSAGFTSTKNFQTVRKIMADTQVDLHLLKQMTEENVKHLPNKRTDYTNTQLYQHLREISNMDKNMRNMSASVTKDQDAFAFNMESMNSLLRHHTLTKEMASQQIKESGYRMLTLGDVSELVDGELVAKQGVGIDIDSRTNAHYTSLLDEINRTEMYSSKGKITQNDNWKNLIIDSDMRINDEGKILDFRMSVDSYNAFKKSVATDFKLPLVQFNPFKSLMGWDKAARIDPMYGYIGPNQFNATITGIAGQEYTVGQWLGDTFGKEFSDSYIGVIDGNLFITKPRLDKNGVQKGRELFKIGEGFRLHNITHADESMGLKPLHNAVRQMSGIKTNIGQDESTFKGSGNDKINKIYKYLDLGFEEWTPEQANLFEAFDSRASIDEFQNKLFERARKLYTDAPRRGVVDGQDVTFKTMFGKGPEAYLLNGKEVQPRMYDVTKKGYTLTAVYDDIKANDFTKARKDLHKFGYQYFSGQRWDGRMDDYFTERSGVLWTVFNQISEGLKTAGLGLGVDSKKSSWKLGANLLLKRALPIYMLTQTPGMINYLSEPFFGQDEDGNRGNITKMLMNGVAKPIDIGAHKAMDLVGATNLFKFIQDTTPGFDQITELPGIHMLGLGQTAEERKEYIESGYDPVRKGRYWGAGNTPFTGGKIEYWGPNIYRRVKADVEFSDSKYGSRQEYYNNTWYPNIVNPLAPLNHFIFDRNHYDKKHYYDRPYLQTAPEGAQMPLFGPLFSQTIGRILNPPKKMHIDYWKNGLQIDPTDETASPLLTNGSLYPVVLSKHGWFNGTARFSANSFDNSKADRDVYNKVQIRIAQQDALYKQGLSQSAYQAKQMVSKSYIQNAGITFQQTSILPTRTYDRYDTPFEVYTTPSGGMSIVDVPDVLNLYNVNQDLTRWSINKVIGANQRITIDDINGPGIPVIGKSQEINNAFLYGVQEQYNWLGEVAGLKGFALQQFVTGYGNEKAAQIEDSGHAYSFSNNFWEENLGGLGANMSEITRRFIPKRNKGTTYVNPIRNTMPSWMPGSGYFTDFKHGDPYSKIMNGEERLPGEGYERLHGIKNLTEFNIGSSSIGYDQSYIVRHMLKQDVVDTGFESDTLATGTRIHKEIQNTWLDAGVAFSVEGEVKDNRNGIIGYYDAMIHDPTSRTGVGIVDIKTTSAKKLEEIRKSGQALQHHQRQVNYYLWATQNEDSRGYIYYVDKENPMNAYTVGFDYSRDMLEDTLNNVYAARKTIRKAVDEGVIGRGELYSAIDQYRILADVAPYSQELQNVKARLAHEMPGMKSEKRKQVEEEMSRINARMQEQKEPLRVYPYKFKTSNLKTESVTVQKIIDNNTIVTKEYGKKHAIKFVGIHVSESNSELYDDHRTMAKAAHDEIRKFVRPGQKIKISYDADERNKYSKDSTRSIRAVIETRGANLNQRLLRAGVATEKEEDDSPAAIRARYSKGEIAFGSAMETFTHTVVSKIPFVGSKMLQVRSPYESYRDREVYGKDFQSWNNPIRDILIPNVQQSVGNVYTNTAFENVAQVVGAAFIGSLFGAKNNQFGKIVGTVIGGTTVLAGKGITAALGALDGDKDRDWRPKRRRDQEELNEYIDTLKYVKNIRLYEQYKGKARREDHFDVDEFMQSKESAGVYNSIKRRELEDFKRKVKLDFKHRGAYNFKYGEPKYVDSNMTKKQTISAINQEISELQSQRKVTKVPENALKAIEFKKAADQTMYGYNPGDSLVDIMSALPKKDRQYFKHFMDAPEEEKRKILRIAPKYMRRALQSVWGRTVDKKPTLDEYFMTHGLPDENWVGWSEKTDMNDVKVKLVHQNKLDPGEFDIWDDNKEQADAVSIPIPQLHATNTPRQAQIKLQQLLGRNGYNNVQVSYMSGHFNNSNVVIREDARDGIATQIAGMQI